MGEETFINILSAYCEISIFTSTQYYADIVIDGLDCKNNIDHKLYRQYTDLIDGNNVKDLSKLEGVYLKLLLLIILKIIINCNQIMV